MNKKQILYWGIGIVAVAAILVIVVSMRSSTFTGYEKGGIGGSTLSMAPMVADMAYEEAAVMRSDIDSSAMQESYVIKRGDLSIRVNDANESANAIEAVAGKYEGTVINRSLYNYDDTVSGYVTIRVASESFERAMQEIRDIARIVESDTVNMDDVTETVMDLDARLRNAEAEEARYLEILDQANSVEDVLNVESHLSQVRERIERYQSQMDYYETHTSQSSISVYLTEETSVGIETSFRPLQIIIDAAQAVVELFQGLVSLIIYIVIVGGAIAIPGYIIYLIGKLVYLKVKK